MNSHKGENPKISVVTPSFNQGQFIEETILSIIDQEYPNLEYIVVDNESDDETPTILEKYAGHIDLIIREQDKGQTDALRKGFDRTSGDILAWVNADDILCPNALETVAEKHGRHPECVLWIGATRMIDLKTGKTTVDTPPLPLENPFRPSVDLLRFWHNGLHFLQPATFFSAKAYETGGGLDLAFDHLMDIDLWVRLAELGPIHTFDHILAEMKSHPERKSARQIDIRELEYVLMKEKHGLREDALRHMRDYEQVVLSEMSLPKAIAHCWKRILRRAATLKNNNP